MLIFDYDPSTTSASIARNTTAMVLPMQVDAELILQKAV